MFALIFGPHVTIFCIFWLHECLKWILAFNSKSLFWCQSRQIFEVRAIEQRHHEFQPIHMPPHQFWPRYHSDGLSPVHVHFEFFSKQICNVEALICHFYKNIKTLTQIHFPRDAHIFRTCTIFYRHYKGLHQMRKDLVLCALICQEEQNERTFLIFLFFLPFSLFFPISLSFSWFLANFCCQALPPLTPSGRHSHELPLYWERRLTGNDCTVNKSNSWIFY